MGYAQVREGYDLMDMKDINVNIDDKLYMDRYNVDIHPHLAVKNQDICKKCESKSCTTFCPARVYEWKNDRIIVGFEGCLECGACRIGCPHDNIDWKYPRGGFGVQFRNL